MGIEENYHEEMRTDCNEAEIINFKKGEREDVGP